MSNYDYYRGSSSYEDAVRNRLNALAVTGAATTHAVRSMESGIRNDIQANTNAIQEMTLGLRSDIRESTYALVASQAMLAQTFQYGFNAINNTLEFGFGMVSNKLDAMSDRICSKLDEIHDIVNNPLLTQSRELFRRALNNYNRGYYEEALEDCKGAVEKNKTDFISWNLLGHIYLFGAGKFSNVIAVDKAEEAFYNAAKYIDSDIGHSDEANILASEIYYYLGLARLIKSNDYLIENKSNESNAKLLEAEKASSNAYRLSSSNLFAGYEQAKELHFLNRDSEALNILEKLIRAGKNFALKASTDKNFESLWNQIDALIMRLRDELVPAISKKIKDFESQAKAKYDELKSAANIVNFWTEKENKDFDDFCKKNITWSAFDGEDDTIKIKNTEKFDNLAKEIGINKFGLKEEMFYNHRQPTYKEIYYSINIFNPEHLNRANQTLKELKLEIDKKIKEIDYLVYSYNSVLKEDYFSVLEKYNEMNSELDFKEENHNFFWGSKGSKIGFIPGVLKNLQKEEIQMKIYLATKKEWEKRSNEQAKYDAVRMKQNDTSEKICKTVGTLIGLIIGLGISIILIHWDMTDESANPAYKSLFGGAAIYGALAGFILGLFDDFFAGLKYAFGGAILSVIGFIILLLICTALLKINIILGYGILGLTITLITTIICNLIASETHTAFFYRL